MPHSPGPWTLQDDETFSSLGDQRIVATNLISPGIVFGGLGAETTANAHLIAAAPDLLDALKTVRRGLQTGGFLRRDGAPVAGICDNLAELIAKAEGR